MDTDDKVNLLADCAMAGIAGLIVGALAVAIVGMI